MAATPAVPMSLGTPVATILEGPTQNVMIYKGMMKGCSLDLLLTHGRWYIVHVIFFDIIPIYVCLQVG